MRENEYPHPSPALRSSLSSTTRRPETVFAILEDGMPGGRLETRERVVKTQERFKREEGVFGERGNVLRVSASSPGFPPGGLAVMPNTPPRCLRGRKEVSQHLFLIMFCLNPFDLVLFFVLL